MTVAEEIAVSPTRLEPLAEVETIADVTRNIDAVIGWSIEAQSHIGYFAVLYKRVTMGIETAIAAGKFEDGPRMEQLDIAFARRYFNALNAYFHPESYGGLTLPWEVSFVGDADGRTGMLQHMMAGLNAHIRFDLAFAAMATAPGSLSTLEEDFNRVNAVLCSQIPGMLDAVEKISPAVRYIRWAVPSEVFLLQRMLKKLRHSAWWFAVSMALRPDHEREKRVNQASWTAALGAWYREPPGKFAAFPQLVKAVARRETGTVADNLRVLAKETGTPVPMSKSYLLRSRRTR